MTAAPADTAQPSGPRAEARRPGFGALLLAEWTKIRTVQSTLWSLALLVLLNLGFTGLLAAVFATQWDSMNESDRAMIGEDPAGFFLGAGLSYSQLTVCVLGVLLIASEYSTGMIRSSLLAVPARLPMLWAKALVFAAIVLVLGVAVSFGSFFLGAGILGDRLPVGLGDPGVLRAVFGGGLYLAMLGLFSLAIGAIVRHTAGAITGVIGLVLVLSPLASLLPGRVGEYVNGYLPSTAGMLITAAQPADDGVLGPWSGYGVFALWTAVLLGAAAYLLKRRDA
ncbi:ABC transporter permease [Actinomadura sp. WMMB 499]|uniref:ABC transporter permease n=1 Tax=Actinomadura sp. WMMB 499 TaxID=1219491 RepID=UPI0012490C8D|nr:ABC transporter permease [Actinomadura sp. WMMB 499]QFG19888.1 ABC transporter permease [Actinomadura sp. WMMB 499]